MNSTTMNPRHALSLAIACGLCVGTMNPVGGVAFAQPAPKESTPAKPTGKPDTKPDTKPAAKPAGKPTPTKGNDAKEAKAFVDGVLAQAATDGNTTKALEALNLRRDQIIAWEDASKSASEMRELTRGVRLLTLVAAGPEGKRAARLKAFGEHPKFATELAFLVRMDHDKPIRVLEIADELLAAYEDRVEDLAALAAACCVVFDEPLSRQLNENRVESAPVKDVFAFLGGVSGRMVMNPRQTPAELLAYVVDVTSPNNELAGVEARYRGDANVGKRYSDIQYDTESFRDGKPKKVTVAGFSLPNIQKHGGVCIDQAYFASQVGKTLGVPTVIVVGKGSGVSHAWIGFLTRRGGAIAWDMTQGRYEGYTNVQGTILSPQTRQEITEGELNVLASFASEPVADRRDAVGLVDAALRVRDLAGGRAKYPPAKPEGVADNATPATLNDALRLSLLEDAARRSPGLTTIWEEVTAMSSAKLLDSAARKRWAEGLVGWCMKKYPDFACDTLIPLIASVEDVKQQDQLWEWAFKAFAGKPSLAARIRFANAEMWEKANRPDEAWKCYSEVIARYINDGAEPIIAGQRVMLLLSKNNRPATDAIPLFAESWKRTQRPSQMAAQFATQSAWYQFGTIYAELLKRANRQKDADLVLKQLGASDDPKKTR